MLTEADPHHTGRRYHQYRPPGISGGRVPARRIRSARPHRSPTHLSRPEESSCAARRCARRCSWSDEGAADNVAVIAREFAQIVTTAFSQKEVAELLGVSASRIRQRSSRRASSTIRTTGGGCAPLSVWGRAGASPPGLEAVLRALRPEAHPVAVQRFFHGYALITSETLNRPEPHEWLLTGHPPGSSGRPGRRSLMAKFPNRRVWRPCGPSRLCCTTCRKAHHSPPVFCGR